MKSQTRERRNCGEERGTHGTEVTQMGTLSSARSASFVMKGSGGAMPSVGVTGTVLKKVDKQMGSMSFSAWLQIAADSDEGEGRVITLKIDKRNFKSL